MMRRTNVGADIIRPRRTGQINCRTSANSQLGIICRRAGRLRPPLPSGDCGGPRVAALQWARCDFAEEWRAIAARPARAAGGVGPYYNVSHKTLRFMLDLGKASFVQREVAERSEVGGIALPDPSDFHCNWLIRVPATIIQAHWQLSQSAAAIPQSPCGASSLCAREPFCNQIPAYSFK